MTQVTTSTTEVTPKAPSKKSQAVAIFNRILAEREQGLFGSNKAFRAAVLTAIQSELTVTVASASTMYNSAVKEAGITIGRDPKQVKVRTGSGKRGRPAGSRNKPKAEALVVQTTEVAPTAETVA